MSHRQEFVNVVGLRLDGRRAHEPRQTRCSFDVSKQVDGSACFEQGLTRVVAVVQGPREVSRRSEQQHDRAVVNVEYSERPYSTSERRARKGDRIWTERATTIRSTLESVLMLELYPRTQIDIFISIEHADGGKLSAAINAASLALVDAGVAMRDFVVSCSCGFLERTPLVDLCHAEEVADGPEMPLAIFAKSEEVALLQIDSKVPLDVFEELLGLAVRGCRQIHDVLKNELREHTLRLLEARNAPQS